MSKIEDLERIPRKLDIMGGIDITGTFASVFNIPTQMPGCLFLLCTRGKCTINVHLDQYRMEQNSLVVIFPGVFFQIVKKSKDCRFIFLSFSTELVHSSKLFSYSIEFTPYIFERPVLQLIPKAGRILEDYFLLFIRSKHLAPKMFDKEQATMAYTQLILGVGGIFKTRPKKNKAYNRDRVIMQSLVRIIIDKYKDERNIAYYADKICLSTQHLSSIIKKMTGKSLKDLIANLVIHDAKAKLRSTELSIQEISDSLSFTDISAFGKYFKRYSGVTPSQYRNGNKE